MRFVAFALLAAMFGLAAGSVAQSQPTTKSKTDPKGKADAAAEPKLNMKMTLADVRLGTYIMGPKFKADDLKGQVVLVDYWGVNCGPCLHVMPSTAALNAELSDFGLVVLGSHVQEAKPDEVKSVATNLGANFSITSQTRVNGSDDYNFIPHCFLFDQTGACVYRGSPAEVEPLVRTAVGKALVEGAGREKFSTAVSAIVQDLKKGNAPSLILPRLVALQNSSGQAGIDAKALLGSLTAAGKKKLDLADSMAADEPVEAFLLVEKLPAAYKGTPLARQATETIGKLKKTKAVSAELAARPTLEVVRKIERQLNMNLEGVSDPKKDEFQKANSALLKQLKDRLATMKKTWPDAHATQAAVAIGEKFIIAKN